MINIPKSYTNDRNILCKGPINGNTVSLSSYVESCIDTSGEVSIPYGVKGVCDEAFMTCLSLKKVTVPDTVTFIGREVFSECIHLRQINLPDSITDIGDFVFYKCYNLEKIELPKKIETIPFFAFENCTSLKRIVIPESVKKIESGAFSGCIGLRYIKIPRSVTYIDDIAFRGCKKRKGWINRDVLTIYTVKGSYAEKYAKENKINFEIIKEKAEPKVLGIEQKDLFADLSRRIDILKELNCDDIETTDGHCTKTKKDDCVPSKTASSTSDKTEKSSDDEFYRILGEIIKKD